MLKKLHALMGLGVALKGQVVGLQQGWGLGCPDWVPLWGPEPTSFSLVLCTLMTYCNKQLWKIFQGLRMHFEKDRTLSL